MKKKLIWLPLCFLIVFSLLLSSCSLLNNTATETVIPGDDLVAVLAQAPDLTQITAQYEQQIKPDENSYTQYCWVRDQKMRIEWSAAGTVEYIDIIDMTVKTIYHCYMQRNTAKKDVYPQNSYFDLTPFYIPLRIISQMTSKPENYQYAGDEYIDNHLCYIYEFAMDKYWINSENGLPVKYQRGIETYEFKNYWFNVNTPDSMFELPAGVTVTEETSY